MTEIADDNKTKGRAFPQELMDFFAQAGGRSLIIKGGPGTGKTTFALELTEVMQDTFNTMYISSRVDEIALGDHFPWLKKDIVQKEFSFMTEQRRRMMAEEGKTIVNRNELDKLESRVEMGEEFDDEGDIEDYQPPSYGAEDGQVVFDMAMILPEIDMVYEAVEKALPQRSLVIIDSIEALSEKYGISSRKLIYTLQKDLVEHTKTNLIFILEKSDHTDLEFLSDGVLKLESAKYDNRRLRRMDLIKLRGVKISTPALLFTLMGGHFRFFDITSEPIILPSESSMEESSCDLDKLLYSVKPSSINLLEMGDGVDTSIILKVLVKRIASSISQGFGVYVLLPGRVSIEDIEHELSRSGFTEENMKCLKFLEMAEMGGNLGQSNMIPIEGESIHDDFRWDAISHSLYDLGKPYTAMICFDTLKSIYGPDSYLGLMRHISMLTKNKGTFFGLGWTTNQEARKFSNYAHTHVRIETIERYPVIFGERPYTNLNFLSIPSNTPGEKPLMKALPIL
ncbi:MAG: hypothetical protein KAS16_07915 [Thermoplasmata archaeon]|nr:hypothetical protein [Thermoplasmata archaeon]